MSLKDKDVSSFIGTSFKSCGSSNDCVPVPTPSTGSFPSNENTSPSDKDFLKKKLGFKITILEQEPLGKGTYGRVYKCYDEYGTVMAIKCISTDHTGISCLMEASIMSAIHHPNLHRAVRIHATPKTLYIVSELALSDLSHWTRRDKGGTPPSLVQLQRWAYDLLQAVACLHRHHIIHGDIKASNVLLFPDGNVRLSDFTLSTKMWPQIDRRYTVCTHTHRPLEVILHQNWDTSVDLWSLGCTLYEIAYGEPLFPSQGKDNLQIRSRMINLLHDWATNGPLQQNFPNIDRPTIDFVPWKLSPLWSHNDYQLFNSVLLSLLRIDPKERTPALNLLKHPFFSPLKELGTSSYTIISTPSSKLDDDTYTRLQQTCSRYTSSRVLIDYAIDLYSRLLSLSQINDTTKIASCLWIGSKLIHRTPLVINDIPLSHILSAERLICIHLSFRLTCLSLPTKNL